MINISLLVTNFEKTHLFKNTLVTIVPQLIDGDEIIVVDDGKYDGMLELLKLQNFKYKYVATNNEKYRSGVKAKNLALKNSSNELCVINDPEVLQITKCITQLRKIFEENTDHLFINAGTVQFCQKKTMPQTPTSHGVDQMAPFCAGVRRQDLMDIGGWDERFKYWGNEDNDLTHRLGLNGVKHIANNDLVVRHQYHSRPSKESIGDANESLLYEKNKSIVANVGKKWGCL